MNWAQLAFKEWQRRPARTTVTAAGVATAIAAFFCLLEFQRGYRAGVRNELDRLGAHVLVVPKGCPYDAASMALHGASWPCYLKQQYLDEVRAVPGIATVAPCFMTALHEADGTQAVYVGIEKGMLALKPGWRFEGSFPARDGDVLAGAELARSKGWNIGQRIMLPGLKDQAGVVAGILAPTHGAEDSFAYIGLADAQRRFHHSNELTHMLVRLRDPNDLDTVVPQLRGCDAGLSMNVIPLAQVYRTIQSLANSTHVLLDCIALVAFLVAGAGVSNAVLMAVVEREKAIGVMRAFGASVGQVFWLVWLETIQVCLGGAIFGIGIAFLASRSVEGWVRSKLPYAPADALIHWDWAVGFICVAGALALGSIAGFLPAWRAARVPPMTAIRGSGGRA